MKRPEWLIEKAGVGSIVKTTFLAGVQHSYIAFSKTNAHGRWALDQFNKGHQLIATNGTLQRIRQAWLEKLSREKLSAGR